MEFSLVAFVCLLLLLFAAGSIIWWSIRNGISPMPTSGKAKLAILGQIPEKFQGRIYELGSGWGTLILPLAKGHPNAAIVGFETSPIPFLISYARAWCMGQKNIVLKRKDFFHSSFADADIVICYLFPEAMKRLKSKFEGELKPGVIVISNTFAIPGWKPLQVVHIKDIYSSKIYLYVV